MNRLVSRNVQTLMLYYLMALIYAQAVSLISKGAVIVQTLANAMNATPLTNTLSQSASMNALQIMSITQIYLNA